MDIVLREHQVAAAILIETSWRNNYLNTLSVLPTGAGKTILKAEMARRELAANPKAVIIVMAHRDVLLEQISDAFCMFGISHSFITSQKTRKQITDMHLDKYGKSFDVQGSRVFICSVDKLRRTDTSHIDTLVTLWMLDEAHHLLAGGKWDDCINRFVYARGLGVTATPIRADKRGLGRWANGLFDDMTCAVTMHELIERNMLSPYRVYCPEVLVDYTNVTTTSSGDYNQVKNAAATDKAEITGDVIKNYKRIASGKQTICFTCNIEHGEHVAAAFKAAGISAVALSSKTESGIRNRRIKEFKAGLITVLVNTDLFGEGFDVPSVECVIMLRKTLSYSLYKQQFGRALRILDGKDYGILIDHVGNVDYMMGAYYLESPHDDPEWSLDDYKKFQVNDDGKKSKAKKCSSCDAKYIPQYPSDVKCPYCLHVETEDEKVSTLKKLQATEADLVEMSNEFITRLMAERNKVDINPATQKVRVEHGLGKGVAAASAAKHHEARFNAQKELRELYDKYCLHTWMQGGHDVESTQRQFEIELGINFLKAQVLGTTDATTLIVKLKDKLNAMGAI